MRGLFPDEHDKLHAWALAQADGGEIGSLLLHALARLDDAERELHDYTATDVTIAVQEREEIRLQQRALWILAHDLANHLCNIQSLPPPPPGVGPKMMMEIIIMKAIQLAEKDMAQQEGRIN